MATEEIQYTDTPKVSCGGNNGTLGHPLIYLDITGKSEIACPYCSKRFVLKQGSKAESH